MSLGQDSGHVPGATLLIPGCLAGLANWRAEDSSPGDHAARPRPARAANQRAGKRHARARPHGHGGDPLRDSPRPDLPERAARCGQDWHHWMSFGGITSFYAWLLDDRVAAAAPICGGVGSLETFIRLGRLSYHGTYWWVPGMLRRGDHGDFASAMAPRPLMVWAPSSDVGMPREGVDRFREQVEPAYARAGRSACGSISRRASIASRWTHSKRWSRFSTSSCARASGCSPTAASPSLPFQRCWPSKESIERCSSLPSAR